MNKNERLDILNYHREERSTTLRHWLLPIFAILSTIAHIVNLPFEFRAEVPKWARFVSADGPGVCAFIIGGANFIYSFIRPHPRIFIIVAISNLVLLIFWVCLFGFWWP